MPSVLIKVNESVRQWPPSSPASLATLGLASENDSKLRRRAQISEKMNTWVMKSVSYLEKDLVFLPLAPFSWYRQVPWNEEIEFGKDGLEMYDKFETMVAPQDVFLAVKYTSIGFILPSHQNWWVIKVDDSLDEVPRHYDKTFRNDIASW